ncbi:zinc finger protein 501-like [Chrysoperla carnea]|uniref:zinc finger protein 501-like n=1 Tax=Chrysoperla carnea TaxID=189513 RepID=UPI001D07CFF4|nr:zinc finger protein 501-like [Chrysoperla carnea]
MKNIMATELDFKDFEKICRVCTRLAEKLTSIMLYNIIDMIKACTSVKIIQNDELPHQVCEICLARLQNAFNFKELCENSDYELRQIYIKKRQKEEITIEDVKLESYECKSETSELLTEQNESKWFEDKPEPEDQQNDLEDYDEMVESKGDNDTTDSENECLSKRIERSKRKLEKTEKYNCELCKHTFDGVWRLGVHMKRIHNAEGKQCTKCSLICYHELHLEAHERTHIDKKFTCDICNKNFANSRKLKKHKIAHSTDRPYHCTQCDKSFKEKCVLTQHVKRIHINPDPHEVCQICGKSVGKASLERHLTIHDKRLMYPCTECPKKFFKEISLTKHVRRVHQNEALRYMYLCNICGRGLLSKAELRRHLCTHTGEKPFECTNCDKRYNDRGALRRHIKSAHLDERPFSCTVCSRAFHTKLILQNHMRRHTGERPFPCLVCGKSFGFKTVLQTHMKVHSS